MSLQRVPIYIYILLSDQSLILGINALSASKTHVASLMLVGISLYIQDAHDLKVIRKTDREYIVYISSPIFHMYLFYVGYGLKHSTVCMDMPSSHLDWFICVVMRSIINNRRQVRATPAQAPT